MGNELGVRTYREIITQFDSWEAAIKDVLDQAQFLKEHFQQKSFGEVVFTGCGSSYYSSLTAAAIFQTLTGIRTRGLPASELFLFPDSFLVKGSPTLLVAISRSGETTETIQAVQAFKERYGGDVLAVSCYKNSRLVSECDISLIAREGKEESVVQTRSFTTMLLMLELYAGIVSGQADFYKRLRALPKQGKRIINEHHALVKELGEKKEVEKFVFLGSGVNYGLACEAMLKMKEVTLTSSEAFHFLEFRHGPKATVDEKTLVVGFVSDSASNYELEVTEEMRNLGAKTLVFTDKTIKGHMDYLIQLNSGFSDLARGLLYIPPIQLLAYYKALSRGLDPDHPRHLDAVVKLEKEVGK